jgi:predicted signal transduction protein with EAL and GGDEF domain
VLEQLAGRLQEALSEEDTVARLGGDEFGILIPDLNNAEDVAALVEGVMERIHQPFRIQGYDVPSVTRIGVSIYPDKAASAGDLIEQADAAMYEAKAEGVRYRFFSRELTEKAQDRVQLGSELRQALVSGEGLQVYYQPQVQLADGSWTGMEALARWYHPSRGWISPGRFIPVAERSGLVVELGGFVLECACAQQRKWLDQGYDFGRMGVNFSAMQLVAEDLVDKVMTTLEGVGLPAERLEVEITESLLVEPDEGMVRRLQQLREHGVRVSIDDFGTGYSSLSYLKDLPVDCLKIDRSFVDGLPEDAHVTAISRAITALGHSLGFSVIAEGIETVEQCQSLLTEGCERGQGFYFARPEAAVELLEHHPCPGAQRR